MGVQQAAQGLDQLRRFALQLIEGDGGGDHMRRPRPGAGRTGGQGEGGGGEKQPAHQNRAAARKKYSRPLKPRGSASL